MKKKSVHWRKYLQIMCLIKDFYLESLSSKNKSIKMGKEYIPVASKLMKSPWKTCSTLSVIREMQRKTTIRCHTTPVRMVKNKLKHTCTAGRNVTWYNHFGSSLAVS